MSADFPQSYPQQPEIFLRVALDLPLPGLFDYVHHARLERGVRVLVRFGHRQLIGMVWQCSTSSALAREKIRPIIQVLDDLPAMPASWLRLADFAASYYHRPLGEVLLPALPAPLRRCAAYTGKRAGAGPVARSDKRKAPKPASAPQGQTIPALNPEQSAALLKLQTKLAAPGASVSLLHGVTGSGKTELYLRLAQQVLEKGRQVLLLVPEINLTPQFEALVRARLSSWRGADGADALAVLHSSLADGERLRQWLRVLRGQADILLGTRLALFTPMPNLGLIIVDEEHDSSYRQQDGLRYSARDLAIWRAHDEGIAVVLGSATPSLESWRRAQAGNYDLVSLKQRALAQALPSIRLVDTRRAQLEDGFTPQALEALAANLASGSQSLVFLNRRGYAPVLRCPACAWSSRCDNCSAFMVLHRGHGRRQALQCHHCGAARAAPLACPECGEQDIRPMGRGTQRLEESLEQKFPTAKILRIDADSTRRKGSAKELFDQVHSGGADILVGTQMVAKGHDFANLGLVVVINADTALFSHDFRAPERLFAQLMQVSGRAGRRSQAAQVLVQTDYPDQAVYQCLLRHDYDLFAQTSLQERAQLGLPPFSNMALLTAQAPKLEQALQFLADARELAMALNHDQKITVHDCVPLRVVRVDGQERAQVLFEASQRPSLHQLLDRLIPQLAAPSGLHWQIEVDPQEI